jgi:hypothetical protein
VLIVLLLKYIFLARLFPVIFFIIIYVRVLLACTRPAVGNDIIHFHLPPSPYRRAEVDVRRHWAVRERVLQAGAGGPDDATNATEAGVHCDVKNHVSVWDASVFACSDAMSAT